MLSKRHIIANGKSRRLGLLRSDKLTARMMLAAPLGFQTPPIIDLDSQCGPYLDQGQLGSCADNAACEAMEFLERQGMSDKLFSRLFLYWHVRKQAGLSTDEDTGSTIHDVIRTLEQTGVCYEDTWPYDVGQFTKEPNAVALAEATHHKALVAYFCPTIQTIDASLAQGFPLLFGMTLCESFESIDANGLYLPSGAEIGGHAMFIIGKDDTMSEGGYDGYYKIRNSWGEGWGMSGCCFIPKDLFLDGTAGEAVTIRRAEV